jgi:hypothetical protein
MSRRVFLVAIVLVLLATAAVFVRHNRRQMHPTTKPEVPIQDGKTIDFSSGQPVVRDDAKEKARLEQAVKEIDAAAGNITFAPAKPTTSSTPKP